MSKPREISVTDLLLMSGFERLVLAIVSLGLLTHAETTLEEVLFIASSIAWVLLAIIRFESLLHLRKAIRENAVGIK